MAKAKAIAVKGCTLSFNPSDSENSAQVVITGFSTKVKAEGDNVLTANTQFTITGYTGGSIDVAGSGSCQPFSFTPTATKVKAENALVLLEGDQMQVTFSGSNSSSGATTQVVVVQITDAGQGSVKGL